MNTFADARTRLQSFNEFIHAQPELRVLLIDGEYDFLQWSQTDIFTTFLADRAPAHTTAFTWKDRCIYGFMATVSRATRHLFRNRVKTLLYSADKIHGPRKGDFRMAGMYEALHQDDHSFLEIVHTIPGVKTVRQFFTRRRPLLYLEYYRHCAASRVSKQSFEQVASMVTALECSVWGEREAMVRAMIERLLRHRLVSLELISLLETELRTLGIRRLLSIDDVRHYHELVAACARIGIPSYAFQHGHFTKYHVGWLSHALASTPPLYPSKLFVWSPFWKQELLSLGTYFLPQDIEIGGPMKTTKKPPMISRKKRATAVSPTILIPFETDSPKAEVCAFVARLAAETSYRLLLSIRPDIDRQSQIDAHGFVPETLARLEVVDTIDALLPEIDLVVGTYSTFLYDLVIQGIPVGYLKTSIDFGEGLARNDLATTIDASGPTFTADVERAMNVSLEVLVARRQRLVEGEGDIRHTLQQILS